MRGKRAKKRLIKPDPKFNSIQIAKFINKIMERGKKTVAQKIIYDAFEIISKETDKEVLEIFSLAIKNVSPALEVKGRRIGGANYQVPIVVSGERKLALAFRWLIEAARKRKGKKMSEKIAEELMQASKNEGDAVKKRLDVHRMAEANKAFAHFA